MNRKDTKIQSDENIMNEHSLPTGGRAESLLLQMMAGLEDIKQGRFSGKSILDIGADNEH